MWTSFVSNVWAVGVRFWLQGWTNTWRTNTKRRLLGLGFVLILVFSAWLVHANQPIQLNMMLQASEAVQWEPLVAEFENTHPAIKINLIKGPNATNLREDLYTTSFLLGDTPYDLIYMDIVWVPKFAAAGWLMDMSDRISSSDLQDFLIGDLEGGRYQEGLYRIPFRTDAGMLYYRKDLLEQVDAIPPETTDELLALSRQLIDAEKADWGYVWQGQQYEGLAAMFVEILQGYDGVWIDPKTQEVGLDQPAAIAAVEFLTQTLDQKISPPGVTSYQEEEARRLFENGKTVFMRNWPYAWKLGNEPSSEIKGKFGIKPMVHAPGQASGACQGGWGLGIAKSTRHPDAAWEAVQYFTSADAQKTFMLASGNTPSRRSLFSDPELLNAYAYLPELLTVLDKAVLRPPIPQYAQASDILQRYLSAAITGQLTPEKAMKAAARETRQLLK